MIHASTWNRWASWRRDMFRELSSMFDIPYHTHLGGERQATAQLGGEVLSGCAEAQWLISASLKSYFEVARRHEQRRWRWKRVFHRRMHCMYGQKKSPRKGITRRTERLPLQSRHYTYLGCHARILSSTKRGKCRMKNIR